MAKICKPDYAVGEMDDLKPWSVTLTYHDQNGDFYAETETLNEVDIGDAVQVVSESARTREEAEHWSDWIITNVNLIREVH